MVIVTVLKTHASAMPTEELTAGRVGLVAQFHFSSQWDGLGKTAVWEAGGVTKDAILSEDRCEVPPECMIEDEDLRVGVFGMNADGDTVIPTVYALVGHIQRGADPSGDESYPPTPTVGEQAIALAGQASEDAKAAKEAAQAAEESAGQSQDAAQGASQAAAQARADAESAANDAQAAKLLVQTATAASTKAKESAQTAEEAAVLAQDAAQIAAADAEDAVEAANKAMASAEQAADDAENMARTADALEGSMNELREAMVNGWSMDEDGFLYLLANGEVMIGPIGPFQASGGGGGGNSSATFTVTISNLLESRILTVAEGTKVELRFRYSSVDAEGVDDGPGVGQLLVGGVVRKTFSAVQGENPLDITDYLAAGSNNVSVRVSNSEGSSKTLPYTVTVAAVSLTSPFDASVPYSGGFKFPYTPVGIAEKTIHFELDGEEIGTDTVTTSGRQVSYDIPAQSHGAHVLKVWFTCTIEGVDITSNKLYYSIICTEAGNTTPIIALTTEPAPSAEQYASIVQKYRVYAPDALTAPITLEVDGNVVANLTVDRTEQTWTYSPMSAGEITQIIRCGDEAESWTVNVAESTIKVEAETEDLALYLSSYGRSNNEENPGVWESGDIACEFENFNFVSDGWLRDEKENAVLRVTGDARLHIPYQMFASDFRGTGKTIEFEMATREVLNYDATVVSSFSGDRGFTITAQQMKLASEQSQMGTRYKEDEHLRVTFVVEKKAENRLLLCYINGIMSGAVQYPEDDDFSQASPVGITIGSGDCTTDLYCIRVYDNALTRHQVLDNWIADTQDGGERSERYQRNAIYDDYGRVVISQLPNDLCYLVIQADELPQFKGDKKVCSGYFVDLVHPERSFTFKNAEIDVQGTSSQYYYRKNYKIKFKGGFILSNGNTTAVYAMNQDAVPVDTFTMKADVASSEGAFNVVLSMLYNDLCPFKTPAQEEDPRVRQCIEGFPMVIFWAKGNELQFLGKYNFNNDKGTEEVFGFQTGDESWEILQNGTDRVGWHSADFSGTDWKTDFEARYPDKNTNITRLQQLAAWLVSTDTEQATGAAIEPVTYEGVEYTADTAEYRLAKFSAELSDHFIEEAIIFYYLFTEIFLSIDQREKNAFPTYIKALDRWIVLFYDADSSCGTDNKGNLAFDYYLEDIDYTEGGDPVYNGQNSVLWKNLRQTRYAEISAMYQDLRTSGQLSYDAVIGRFTDHQSKWPEAIFNEDMHVKCIEPLTLGGDGLYLPMLQGKKEPWIKWWLYNRFRYMDSKHVTGTSMTNRITIRAHQKANIFLTSYVNMYGHVYFNAADVYQRMVRGQEYEFEWPASGAEDPVIGINDADLLTSLGDLSPLMVELIDVSGAPHLTHVKVGDGAEGYANYSLNSITLGNNVLLRTLDCRNCPNLTMAPDISGCTNIEEVYFEGSAITGLKLPNGGILKKLHLPGTVKNLTLLNQTALSDFQMPSYAGVETLRLENNSAVIDPLAIFAQIPANSRVRITGIDATFENASDIAAFYDRLDTMRGLDEGGNNVDKAQVSGTIHIDALKESELNALQARYPTITIDYQNLVSYLYFYNEDGSELLYTDKVMDGGNGVYVGQQPAKEPTAQTEYIFAGWSKTPGGSVDNDALAAVTEDRSLYAVFSATVRKYTVSFYNSDGTLLQTVQVPYEGSATYTGGTPVYPDDSTWEFKGFLPDPTNVTEDMDCYAQYQEPFDLETASWARISEISNEGTAANYMNVGDTKSVYLNGTVGTLALDTTLYVYVLGINHNSEVEGSGIHFGAFKGNVPYKQFVCLDDSYYDTSVSDGTKCFNMNHWGTYKNDGGWAGCDMRYDILGSTDVPPSGYGAVKTSSTVGYDATDTCATNPVENTLMSCLPADLRSVMKPITKWTNNKGGGSNTCSKSVDFLPLMSEYEWFGTTKNAGSNEASKQKRYDYLADVTYSDHKAYNSTSTFRNVFLRSPATDLIRFVSKDTSGKTTTTLATKVLGIAPVFMV